MDSNRLQEIRERALEMMNNAENLDKLDEARVAFLGKKGELTALLKSMKDVAHAQDH